MDQTIDYVNKDLDNDDDNVTIITDITETKEEKPNKYEDVLPPPENFFNNDNNPYDDHYNDHDLEYHIKSSRWFRWSRRTLNKCLSVIVGSHEGMVTGLLTYLCASGSGGWIAGLICQAVFATYGLCIGLCLGIVSGIFCDKHTTMALLRNYRETFGTHNARKINHKRNDITPTTYL